MWINRGLWLETVHWEDGDKPQCPGEDAGCGGHGWCGARVLLSAHLSAGRGRQPRAGREGLFWEMRKHGALSHDWMGALHAGL